MISATRVAARTATLSVLAFASLASTVQADYAGTVMGTAGLQSYWKLGNTPATPATTPDAKSTKSLTLERPVQTPFDFSEFEAGRPSLVGGTTDASMFLTNTSARTADPSDFLFLYSGAWTVEAWVNVPAVDSSVRTIASKFDGNGGWHLQIVGDGGVNRVSVSQAWNQVDYHGDGWWEQTGWSATGGNITPGTTHHVVATNDGSTLRVYVNASLVASTVIGSPTSATPAPFMLGGSPSPSGGEPRMPFSGILDDVSVYNVALTPSVIAAHRSAGLRVGAPVSTVAPAQSASGATHTTTTGTWSGSPTSFAYRWQVCETDTGQGVLGPVVDGTLRCKTIPGATSASYTTTTATQGKPLRSLVYATNANGTSVRAGIPAPPTVAFTAPAANATISGQTVVTASAGSSVIGVQFLIDGKAVGREDTLPPFEQRIHTELLANGSRTLTAVARNSAYATATASRTVNVSNTIEGAFIRAIQAVSTYGPTYPRAPEPAYSTNLQAKVVRYEAPPDPVDTPGSGPSPVANAIGQYKAANIKVIWLVQKPDSADTDAQAVIQTVDRIRAAHPGTLVAVELTRVGGHGWVRPRGLGWG